MAKYRVQMTRSGYAHASWEIDAPNKEAAGERAHDQEGDHTYNEHDAEYDVDEVTEVKENEETP